MKSLQEEFQSLYERIREQVRTEFMESLGGGNKTTKAKGGKKRSYPCPVCGKPGKGPRWGWFCDTHKNLTTKQKEAAKAKAKKD